MKNNELDDILKEELLRDVQLVYEKAEEDKKAKVPGKIGGLTNLGRTYFTNYGEISEKNQDAQFQMAQKYGSEIYGADAQMQSGGNAGDVTRGGGGLVSCTVNPFLTIPASESTMFESGEGGADGFLKKIDELGEIIKTKGTEWNNANRKEIDGIFKLRNIIKDKGLAQDNKDYIKKMNDIIGTLAKKDKDFTQISTDMQKAWTNWSQNSSGQGSSGGKGDEMGNTAKTAASASSDEWNPNLTFKIDIQTKFDENWYKRKFKSGLLNAAINMFKTDVMSRGAASNVKQGEKDLGNAGHKYTQDQMEPGEMRKLDSIKWKMTNKIAKDYVTFLLGWSRKKERYADPNTPVPNPLTKDEGFGKKLADKALSGRGFFGRLKQKIFAGGQNSNTISVVFQLADYNDGWTVIEKKEEEGGEAEGQEGGADAEGGDTGVETPTPKAKSSGSSGDKKPAKSSSASDKSKPEGQPPPDKDAGGGDEEGNEGDAVSESFDDAFLGVFDHNTSTLTRNLTDESIESDRYKLVKEICAGTGSVEKLVDNCLMGYTYK